MKGTFSSENNAAKKSLDLGCIGIRCYKDDEYLENKISLVDKLDDCDVIFGIKEVPIRKLIENKTYFMFSHTIKKQKQNKELLQKIIEKKIRLIDYIKIIIS